MKKRLKDWITDIFAVIIWGISTYLFIVHEVALISYVILLFVGILFLFASTKDLIDIAKKLLPKK